MKTLFLLAVLCCAISSGRITRTLSAGNKPHTTRQTVFWEPEATNSPVEQPNRLFTVISQYCAATTNFTLTASKITNSEWKVPPPPVVQSVRSGAIIEGFEAEAYPNEITINGTVNYYTPSNKWMLLMGFMVANGGWSFSVEYETVLAVRIQQADIGNNVVYNIVVGDTLAGVPVC